jgi:hypothetical protein
LFSQLEEATYASVYDNPRTGETAYVTKRPNGTYYGYTNKYDFIAQDEEELLYKLKMWGFKINPVGAEKVYSESAGVGVVAGNKKMARDPRYSNSMTVDIKPGETQRQAAKFGNKTNKLGRPPIMDPSGKIHEAAMSTTIQGRNPISAGARGLMAARWKYDTVVRGVEGKNMIGAVARLASQLDDIEQIDYASIDDVMQNISVAFQVDPKDLHDAFIAKYKLTPDAFAAKLKHDRANRPKSV